RIDRLLQRAWQALAAAVLLHPLPEMDVVVVLASIVEEALVLAEGLLHDLFEGQAVHASFGRELVAIVDIRLVVLVVMVLKRLLRHEGLQSLVVVRKFRKFKGHSKISLAEMAWIVRTHT